MKLTRQRYQQGSLEIQSRKSGGDVWFYRYYERQADGSAKRRGVLVGTVKQYPTRSAAEKAAGYLRIRANENDPIERNSKTLSDVIDRFIAEEMSKRYSTRAVYLARLENHIRPQWGERRLEDIKAINVRTWLRSLNLSAGTKGSIHGLMRQLFRYAMLWEWIPVAENPMSLFRIEGQRRKQLKRILTVEEFYALLEAMPREPFRTMLLTAMCIGVRRSEFIALKWKDFDWHQKTLYVRRGIVDGHIGDVKTIYSEKPMPLDDAFAEILQRWRTQTEFSGEEDWVFASPFSGGKRPYQPNAICNRYLRRAGKNLGLGRIGWHTMRHTYRSWLDGVGTPIGVMKDLMRHADIRTTMNIYGGSLPEPMREANSKVVRMALRAS